MATEKKASCVLDGSAKCVGYSLFLSLSLSLSLPLSPSLSLSLSLSLPPSFSRHPSLPHLSLCVCVHVAFIRVSHGVVLLRSIYTFALQRERVSVSVCDCVCQFSLALSLSALTQLNPVEIPLSSLHLHFPPSTFTLQGCHYVHPVCSGCTREGDWYHHWSLCWRAW
jgi:hypothetical protein